MNAVLLSVAGLDLIPSPWVPSTGDVFEGRVRGCDRWHLMLWPGWWRIDQARVLADVLDDGPRPYDIIDEMRPVPFVYSQDGAKP